MKKKLQAAAVIPIKTNNQRLPGKNTKILGDKPLLNHLFDTLSVNSFLSAIYIDSSDQRVLNIAKSYGYETIVRPEELNTPETSGHDLINFEIPYITQPVIAQLFVTMPFLKNETINNSINMLTNNDGIDSVFGVVDVYNRFWFNNLPINHAPEELVGSQYMQSIQQEAGFYVFRKDAFLNEQTRITKSHVALSVDVIESIDIDEEIDFYIAESIYKWKFNNAE